MQKLSLQNKIEVHIIHTACICMYVKHTTDLCADILKDRSLPANVLILLNKIPSPTSNFLPLPIVRPSISLTLPLSRSGPLLLFLYAYFPFAPTLFFLPVSSFLFPKGHEPLLRCNYSQAAGTYFNIY